MNAKIRRRCRAARILTLAVVRLGIVVLAGACASSPPRTQTALSGPPTPAHACPLGLVSGVDIEDTRDGVDLTFVTTPARVADLRRRVREAAKAHGPGAHEGLGHEGLHGMGQRHGLRLWDMPPVQTTVTDVDRGARLRLVAIDASRTDALRTAMHERAPHVAAGECP